jgi:Zn-dependent protease with chaperone function
MSGTEGPVDESDQNPSGSGSPGKPFELPGPREQRPQLPPAGPPGSGNREIAGGVAPRPPAPGGYGLLWSEIVNGVMWFGSSFLILFWICQFLNFKGGTWALIAIWILSGLVILWPGSDGLVARYLFGLRQPTMVEWQRLRPSWLSVSQRAGIYPDRYSLWIEGADSSTGGAAGGYTVAVTGWAIYTLPPSHLEAVMAHGYATHLRGHSWPSRLALWYSVPARIVALLVRLLLKLSRTVPVVGCTIVGFLLVAYIGIILIALVFYDSLAVPMLYLVPLFAPLLFIGVSRWNERMADRAAADLGYGRRLLEVFYGWQAQHQDVSRRMGLAQPDWLAGQPSVAERIRALEVYLQPR